MSQDAAELGMAPRRSPRVVRAVLLKVERGEELWSVESTVINAHGALVHGLRPIPQGGDVIVTNQRTGARSKAWVVALRPPEQPGTIAFAIEFLEHVPDFWGDDYSP